MAYNDKQIAAQEAASRIKDEMVIGIGSGSTVNEMLRFLAKRIEAEGIRVSGIPSSLKTERLAKELEIPLTTFAVHQKVDIAIDGTDEVDSNLHLIKGGGGSLVREKMVDMVADKFIVIADQSKMVKQLGNVAVPVEIVPYGWQATEKRLEQIGCQTNLRYRNGEIFVSDNQNYIIDCKFTGIREPARLHESIKRIVGVVETGIFTDMVHETIIVDQGNISVLKVK